MPDHASPDVRLLIPGLGHFYRHLSHYSYSFMRFCTGAVLVPHGAQKVLYIPINQFAGNIAAQGFPAPVLLARISHAEEARLIGGRGEELASWRCSGLEGKRHSLDEGVWRNEPRSC